MNLEPAAPPPPVSKGAIPFVHQWLHAGETYSSRLDQYLEYSSRNVRLRKDFIRSKNSTPSK